MFVTSKDAGVRRQNRTYNSNKPARSSKISLLSTFTVTTSSSGGSNNTVTQDSHHRSQHKHRRKRHHRSRRPEQSYYNPSVDVFDFLVEEKSQSGERLPEDGAEDSDDSEDETARPEPDQAAHLDEAEPEGYYRSMSDSGISMASSASGHSPKKRLPVVVEEKPGQAEQHSGREVALIDPRCAWPPYSPQPYPEGFVPPPCPPPPPAVVYDVPVYPYQPYPSYNTPPQPAEGNPGPLITIREPNKQSTKPKCFRTFNKVSTRLLLQMQDEIAELENELKLLDEENDLAEKLEDRSSAHGSAARDRTNREADIYEELHFKLDNYYHFLEMMHKVDSISQPAVTSDLTKHHKWLESRIRQSSRVRQLVGNDLRRFSEESKEKPEPTRTFHPQYLAYCCLINAVIPLILQKIVKGVLNRLILLSLIVVAGSLAQDRMRTTISRDELTCTLVCICISAFAAIFL